MGVLDRDCKDCCSQFVELLFFANTDFFESICYIDNYSYTEFFEKLHEEGKNYITRASKKNNIKSPLRSRPAGFETVWVANRVLTCSLDALLLGSAPESIL